MTLLENGHKKAAHIVAEHQRQLWPEQAAYVRQASDFYQELWGDVALPAELCDLTELPLVDKSMLRAAQAALPPFGNYLAAERSTVNRLHRTSGTTGQAMNLALSARDARVTAVVGGRAQALSGLGPDDIVVHCLNYQMWMGGLTDHMTLEATGALVVPFGVGNSELLVRVIQEVGATAISCTPSYPAVLEQTIAAKFPGLSPRDLGLRLGLFGGEPGLDEASFRERLKATWGFEPRNSNYGVTDVMCNFAGQCTLTSDLHFVAADVLYPELIDPDSGASLAFEANVTGELVLTHLARDCQPLVRFRTGDIVTITATEPCGCGCTGFRFRVVGRSDDMIVVRGLNMFPTMVAAVIGQFPELSGDYRIVLDHPPPYDRLPIHVEVLREARTNLADDIEAAFKAALGATAQITLRPFGSFEKTEGKTQRVVRNYL